MRGGTPNSAVVVSGALAVGTMAILGLVMVWHPSSGTSNEEAHTIYLLRGLVAAEVEHVGNTGKCADLERIASSHTGFSKGYLFELTCGKDARFNIVAWPQERGKTGWRSFFADETGVLRHRISGARADAKSPTLDSSPD